MQKSYCVIILHYSKQDPSALIKTSKPIMNLLQRIFKGGIFRGCSISFFSLHFDQGERWTPSRWLRFWHWSETPRSVHNRTESHWTLSSRLAECLSDNISGLDFVGAWFGSKEKVWVGSGSEEFQALVLKWLWVGTCFASWPPLLLGEQLPLHDADPTVLVRLGKWNHTKNRNICPFVLRKQQKICPRDVLRQSRWPTYEVKFLGDEPIRVHRDSVGSRGQAPVSPGEKYDVTTSLVSRHPQWKEMSYVHF